MPSWDRKFQKGLFSLIKPFSSAMMPSMISNASELASNSDYFSILWYGLSLGSESQTLSSILIKV